MANTAISLTKALKLKNRIAGRLTHIQDLVTKNNSTLEEQHGQIDVLALIKEREEIMDQLVVLKATIMRANAPIQEAILRKGELSSKIEWLKTINTTDGKMRHDYQNTPLIYVAALKKNDIEQQTRALEKEIDALQDKIDDYNATKKIEIDQRTLDLAS